MTAFEADLDRLHAWLNEAASRGAVPVVCGANGDMDTVASAVALAAALPQAMACGRHLGRLAKRLVDDEQAPFRRLGRPTAWPSALGALWWWMPLRQAGRSRPSRRCSRVRARSPRDRRLAARGPGFEPEMAGVRHHGDRHGLLVSSSSSRLDRAGEAASHGRAHHRYGSVQARQASSFRSALTLLEDGELDYRTLVDRIEGVVVVSSCVHGALLKGLQRASTTDAGPWRLVTTRAGTLEGRLASMLLGTGADVCFVVRHRDGKTRVTGRARATACREGLHLGRLLEELAAVHGGEGGAMTAQQADVWAGSRRRRNRSAGRCSRNPKT